MKNFENVQLPQDKFGLHQTCTVYCGVVALSIAYLVGFKKNRVRSYYGRTLSLIPAVYTTNARPNLVSQAPIGQCISTLTATRRMLERYVPYKEKGRWPSANHSGQIRQPPAVA